MKSVAQHLADALSLVAPLPPVEVGLTESLGAVTAADVTSTVTLPPWDNSSMDGYAVVRADVVDAGSVPVTLPVVDDLPAGVAPTRTLVRGEAIRIMTGAPLPEGADAVVPVEWTDAGADVVTVHRGPDLHQNIRRAGEDVVGGEVVLRAGTRLGPRQVGLLAATGHATVLVHARPRVAVLSSGSEIVPPGTDLGPGQIYDSNSWALAAAVTEAGGVAVRVGGVADDVAALASALAHAAADADLVVTSGGVSAGAFDTVKELLSALGTVSFDRTGMQPGMPQGLGTVTVAGLLGAAGLPTEISADTARAVPILTLPGNPVSAFVSFEVHVRPVLRRLLGLADGQRPAVVARAGDAWASPAGKLQVARVRLDRSGSVPVAHLVGRHGSHLVAELSGADALARVPEDVTQVEVGDELVCIPLDLT